MPEKTEHENTGHEDKLEHENINVPPPDCESMNNLGPMRDLKFALEEKWTKEQDITMPGNDSTDQQTQNHEPGGPGQASGALAGELEKIASERDEFIGHLQRLQAEFDNYRKRVLREKAEMTDFLLQRFITQLLTVAENMERTVHSGQEANDVEAYKTGVEMVFQQFMGILKDQGVVKINAVGEIFDPNLHEAIGQVQTDEHEPGVIVNEISPGYKIKERVIQAPKVQVAAAPAAPQNGAQENQ